MGVLQNMAGNAQFYHFDPSIANGIRIWLSSARCFRETGWRLLVLILMTFNRGVVIFSGRWFYRKQSGVDDLLDLQGNGSHVTGYAVWSVTG